MGVAEFRVKNGLIVDEVSMVGPDLIDCISNTMIKVRRDSSPFGGVPIIFVGDIFQLPPAHRSLSCFSFHPASSWQAAGTVFLLQCPGGHKPAPSKIFSHSPPDWQLGPPP